MACLAYGAGVGAAGFFFMTIYGWEVVASGWSRVVAYAWAGAIAAFLAWAFGVGLGYFMSHVLGPRAATASTYPRKSAEREKDESKLREIVPDARV
jgi:hypothetical protein